MSKFKVGQEVIFSKGDLEDVRGVVVVPYFQMSQSDWPEVVVQYGEDRRFFVDIDKVRPAEDSYEYGVTWKMQDSEEYYPVFSDEWVTLEDAQDELRLEKDQRGAKIVRRLKAGEPEDYNV